MYMNIDEALIDRMLVNNAERTRCLNENTGVILSIFRLFLRHLYDSTLIKCCLLTTFMTVSAGLKAYFDNRGSILSIYAKKPENHIFDPNHFLRPISHYVKSRLVPHRHVTNALRKFGLKPYCSD